MTYRMAAAMGRSGLLALVFFCANVASIQAGTFCEDHRMSIARPPGEPGGIPCRQVHTSAGPGLASISPQSSYSYADVNTDFGVNQVTFGLDLSQLNLGDKLHKNVELRVFELGFGLNQPVLPDNGIGGAPPVPSDGRAITVTVSGWAENRVLRFDTIPADAAFSPSLNWGITPPDSNSQTVAVPPGTSVVWVDLQAFSQGNSDWSSANGLVRLLVPGQGWKSLPLSFNLAWGAAVRTQPIYVLSGVVAGDFSSGTMTTTFYYDSSLVDALE